MVNAKFTVKNTAPGNKQIRIFNFSIGNGREKNLLEIPGVTENDIRNSLLKGELNRKLGYRHLTIVESDIELLQFNDDHKEFLESQGITKGISQGGQTTIFAGERVSDTTWRTWTKPSGITMVQFFLVGAGGMGGDGVSFGNPRPGGGGGGAACVTRLVIPAKFLPDTLYVFPADSEFGGGNALVSPEQSLSVGRSIVWAVGGNDAEGDEAAAPPYQPLPVITRYMYMGTYAHDVPMSGSAGKSGEGGPGTDASLLGAACGGASGAGTDLLTAYAGGNILSAAGTVLVAGGITGGNGVDGLADLDTMTFTGGSGGGSSTTGVGGKGGNGGYGCGGGGGGAGVTGGNRGLGGPGFVSITCW